MEKTGLSFDGGNQEKRPGVGQPHPVNWGKTIITLNWFEIFKTRIVRINSNEKVHLILEDTK